jgi:hypothetical protein
VRKFEDIILIHSLLFKMEKEYKTFKDVEAWKSAMELTKLVYGITNYFPKYEKFG